VIREADCIGCFLCVAACPVDAIVGTPRFLHTVLERECTGCELCVPVCPVDCIELVAALDADEPSAEATRDSGAPCIRCSACVPVCPAGLDPAALHWQVAAGRLEAAADLGLEACIECGRCNRACPSAIPLAEDFTQARDQWLTTTRMRADAERARRRFDARGARLEREQAQAARRREQRLAGRDAG
jgi:Na+-translocating ferredoxin:NAD+ oxidoreductase RnfC subunit